jgi:hypothetical protein
MEKPQQQRVKFEIQRQQRLRHAIRNASIYPLPRLRSQQPDL